MQGCPCTQRNPQGWCDGCRLLALPECGTITLPQRGGLCRSRLHCSLLQGKEACEEAALGVVKETKSEGEEGPSRGETTQQVSISPPHTGASLPLRTGPFQLPPWGGDGAPVGLPWASSTWRGLGSSPRPGGAGEGVEGHPGVFRLAGADPWGVALGLCLSAVPGSVSGLRWGSAARIVLGGCADRGCHPSRYPHLNHNPFTSFLFLPQTCESGTRPEEI